MRVNAASVRVRGIVRMRASSCRVRMPAANRPQCHLALKRLTRALEAFFFWLPWVASAHLPPSARARGHDPRTTHTEREARRHEPSPPTLLPPHGVVVVALRLVRLHGGGIQVRRPPHARRSRAPSARSLACTQSDEGSDRAGTVPSSASANAPTPAQGQPPLRPRRHAPALSLLWLPLPARGHRAATEGERPPHSLSPRALCARDAPRGGRVRPGDRTVRLTGAHAAACPAQNKRGKYVCSGCQREFDSVQGLGIHRRRAKQCGASGSKWGGDLQGWVSKPGTKQTHGGAIDYAAPSTDRTKKRRAPASPASATPGAKKPKCASAAAFSVRAAEHAPAARTEC